MPAPKKRKQQLPAVWNTHPFTCHICSRNWAPNQIRICTLRGTWVCQKCRDATLNRKVPNAGRISPAVEGMTCRTCKEPIKVGRRSVVNVHGDVVHYRCPKKPATRT